MSILIILQHKISKLWAKTIQEKLPNTEVTIYPDVKNPLDITFIVAWRPEPDVFTQFPNAKVVQSLGAGVKHLLKTNAVERDLTITRMVDQRLAEDMWEFVLTSIMMHLRKMPTYFQQQKQRKWKQYFYKSIKDTSVAVLGLGQIGGFVAAKLAETGFKVKGWANSTKNIDGVESFVGKEQLANCLAEVDVLVSILPMTEATEGILNKTTLGYLKKGAYLINTGRGGHQVEADLIALLENGHLSGALLDVFATEPLPENHPFWDTPNLTITPHVASLTNVHSAADVIVENYKRMLAGEALLNVVSVEKGY